jgi:hypothetical protein
MIELENLGEGEYCFKCGSKINKGIVCRDCLGDLNDSVDVIILLINNEREFYDKKIEMYKSLVKKMQKGIYEHDKASILFKYLVDVAVKKYIEQIKEYYDDGSWVENEVIQVIGKPEMTEFKMRVASELATMFERDYENKEYDFMKTESRVKIVIDTDSDYCIKCGSKISKGIVCRDCYGKKEKLDVSILYKELGEDVAGKVDNFLLDKGFELVSTGVGTYDYSGEGDYAKLETEIVDKFGESVRAKVSFFEVEE